MTDQLSLMIGEMRQSIEYLQEETEKQARISSENRKAVRDEIQDVSRKVDKVDQRTINMDERIQKMEPTFADVVSWSERAKGARMAVFAILVGLGAIGATAFSKLAELFKG